MPTIEIVKRQDDGGCEYYTARKQTGKEEWEYLGAYRSYETGHISSSEWINFDGFHLFDVNGKYIPLQFDTILEAQEVANELEEKEAIAAARKAEKERRRKFCEPIGTFKVEIVTQVVSIGE